MVERLLGYRETEGMLERYGIRLAPARLVASAPEAVEAAVEMGFPVALKLISPERTHKSDSGLVLLNLQTPQSVLEGTERLLEKTSAVSIEGLLVQKMAPRGVETLVGVSQDAQFGLVVAFGPGGTLVEWLDEISLRLPPLSAWDAVQMLRETRLWKLLQGYRHYPLADVERLVELLVRVARLAVEQGPGLVSLDLNPVIVLPAGQGLYLVDARAVVRQEA